MKMVRQSATELQKRFIRVDNTQAGRQLRIAAANDDRWTVLSDTIYILLASLAIPTLLKQPAIPSPLPLQFNSYPICYYLKEIITLSVPILRLHIYSILNFLYP